MAEVILLEDEDGSEDRSRKLKGRRYQSSSIGTKSFSGFSNQSRASVPLKVLLPPVLLQTSSAPITLAGNTPSPKSDQAPKDSEDSPASVAETQVEEEDGIRPELLPLRHAMWTACWCQIAVVLGIFINFIFISYMFMQYKPEVEKLAKGPHKPIIFDD